MPFSVTEKKDIDFNSANIEEYNSLRMSPKISISNQSKLMKSSPFAGRNKQLTANNVESPKKDCTNFVTVPSKQMQIAININSNKRKFKRTINPTRTDGSPS